MKIASFGDLLLKCIASFVHMPKKSSKKYFGEPFRKKKAEKVIFYNVGKRGKSENISNFKTIVAPASMSFVDNTDQVVAFLNLVLFHFEHKEAVHIQLDYVEVFDYESLVLLLCVLIKFKTARIKFRGSAPLKSRANNYLKNSIFYQYLTDEKVIEDSNRYSFITNLNQTQREIFETSGDRRPDAELSGALIEHAGQTVWGKTVTCPGVQRAMIELMTNTFNHADLEKEGVHHYWISVNHIPHRKTVKFVFLDLGVGVFKSLGNKNPTHKFYNWEKKMQLEHPFDNHATLLKYILDGKLHTTVTGEFYRGKGLPGIKEVLERQQLSKLRIITNDVKGEVYKDHYTLLKHSLPGTFVSWQLNLDNQYIS